MNQLVLSYLRRRNSSQFKSAPIVSVGEHPDPYMRAGSHPDVVERVWNDLGASLPVDCRAMVYGTPALVHPRNGVVLAVACGTSYAIRIPYESIHTALKLGCGTVERWSGGGMTNIEEGLEQGWVFGKWLEEETQWLTSVYVDLESAS